MSPEDSISQLLFYYFASSWSGQIVHVGQKSSLMTRFLCLETESKELDFLVSSVYPTAASVSDPTWAYPKSSLEDSIFMNGPQPSTCCHGSQLGLVFLLTVGSLTASALLFRNSALFSSKTLYETTFLNSLGTQNTHLTQHSQVMFLQYCDYLLVFF